MIVIVTFECDLMEHFDVKSWNEFMGKLIGRNMTPISWSMGKRPPPLGVAFDFRGLQMSHARLSGIDLTFCDLEEANFTGTNLQGAKFGSCPQASFKYALLEGACFRGNISSCCFDGSVGYADFSHAYYSAGEPPTGLPPEILATCEILPDEPDDPDWPPVIVERHLRVHAMIHEVPW
jgi:hypothetical protein